MAEIDILVAMATNFSESRLTLKIKFKILFKFQKL